MFQLKLKNRFSCAGSALHCDPHTDPQSYEALAKTVVADSVSPDFAARLRRQITDGGFAVISTDLDDQAPCTPADYKHSYSGPYYAEATLAVVGGILGQLCGYSVQHGGRLFHDIMPMQTHSTMQTFASSAVNLEMHTELAFVENPPDYLMLFCIRPDREGVAETHLYDSRFALTQLPEGLCNRLAEPGYTFDIDEGATDADEMGDDLRSLPIINGDTLELLRYDIDLCKPAEPKYSEASAWLHEALLGMKISLRLRAGQMVIIDNRRIVHSRNVFKAHFDGQDRWLKRAFVRHCQQENAT